MKKDLIISAVVGGAIVLVVGLVISFSAPQLGGDFAGGIVPSQLFSASVSTQSVTPVLANLYVNGGISAGGVAAANQTTQQYTATTSYPAAAVTLGPSTASTSTTSTAVTVSFGGFSVGDPCSEIAYNGVSSTAPLVSLDANITGVNTSTNTATATVIFFNAATSATTLSVTSTATGASSTLKVTCRHAGV